MSYGDVHTVSYRHGWANMIEGQPQVLNTSSDQREAEAMGREFATLIGVEHINLGRAEASGSTV